MKRKIISIILSIATVFSMVAIPAQAIRFPNSQLIAKYLDGSYEMPSLADIIKGFNSIGSMINKVTGIDLVDTSTLDISLDETMQSIAKEVLDVSGVDFSEVLTIIPYSNRTAKLLQSYSIDVSALQELLNKSAEKYKSTSLTLAVFLKIFASTLSVVDKCEIIATQDEEDSDLYLIAVKVTYDDGTTNTLNSSIYYNKATDKFVGKNGEPAVFGFSMDIDKATTYTGVVSWQRNFGFTVAYDIFCYLTPYLMQYHTERFKFEYNNREYMIQIWKGRYFIANGAEVGIYTRDIGSKGTFYNCATDDEMLYMSLKLYHGDTLLLSRDKELHWWMTGFNVSTTAYIPSSMTMVTTITMNDEDMLNAFKSALDKKTGAVDYEINGLDVTITW